MSYQFRSKEIRLFCLLTFLIFTTSLANVVTAETNIKEDVLTSKRCNQFTFDASSSYDADNENISFEWDFGDGLKSNEAIINHAYEKSGEYNVVLKITDNSGLECSTAQTSQRVRVNLPPIPALIVADQACTNEPVSFDASASQDDSRTELDFLWDFGDGTTSTSKKRVNKIYQQGGDYKVTLTVDDKSNMVCSTDSIEKIIHINEPPKADAGQDEVLRCVDSDEDMIVNFDASASKDVNNDALTYHWDFGDGSQENGIKTTHKFSQIGNYDVKLIVQDNSNLGCGTNVDFVSVKLNKAPEAKAGDDIVACIGESVEFNGSNSYVHKKGTATAQWSFGDGSTAPGFITNHKYTKAGNYQASLSIENKLNQMCPPSKDTKNVVVNSAPTVKLESIPTTCLGKEIHFDASNAADPDKDNLEYYWSFGDGTILKAGSKVAHTYKQGGQYRATVVVDDGKNSTCSTSTSDVIVRINTPPLADAGPNLSCCVDRTSEFNADASSDPDGDNLTYSWNFGDGNTAEGSKVNHSYTASGNYRVSVTIDDNSGTECSTSTAGFTAEVNATPVPVINIR